MPVGTGMISDDDYSLLHEIYSQLFKSMQNSQHCRTVYSWHQKHCILYEEKKPPIWTPVLSLQLDSVFLCQPVPL